MPECAPYLHGSEELDQGSKCKDLITAKTILITGASSGIGKASAELFSRQGWNVVATMRRPEEGEALKSLPNVLVTRLDVMDMASIDAAIDAGVAQFGRLDVLLNNAGYSQFGVFEAVSRERIQQQFEVNVFGVMEVTRAALPHFRAQKTGMIINVSSGAGIFTLPMMSIYSASKFALEGFSESLAYELGPLGIGVKLVLPHGGVSETSFGQRQMESAAIETMPADYAAFAQRTQAQFGKMVAGISISSKDVADAVFGAATDGTSTLRYFVGDDARGFVKARYDLSEADYISFMRSHFPIEG